MPTTTKRSGRLLDAPTVSTTLANNWIVETGLKIKRENCAFDACKEECAFHSMRRRPYSERKC